MVAGHSLGEFSALVVAGALSFEDGLRLVSKRALAMQAACEAQPGTMAAILGLADETVEQACAETEGVVVAANYNCPGQLVISGAVEAVDAACEKLKAAGARRALRLPVGGAFHSPLMEPARAELAEAIAEAPIHTPVCPIYQNVDAKPQTDPAVIRENLIAQLTAPVRWTQIVRNMLADGVTQFTELGPATCCRVSSRRSTPKPQPNPVRRCKPRSCAPYLKRNRLYIKRFFFCRRKINGFILKIFQIPFLFSE